MNFIIRYKKYYFLLLFFYLQVFYSHAQRYICKTLDVSSDKPITNFHVLKDKIYMAGDSGKGIFIVIENNENGILAINAAKIGKDFGMQTLLIKKIKKTFLLKSKISNKNKHNIIQLKGKCDILL